MANLAYELLNEGLLTDEPDIYYNIKDLEADKINLCFILGHSGSGKTTMAKKLKGDKVDINPLDALTCSYRVTNIEEYKEYELMYNFFKSHPEYLGKFYNEYYYMVVNDFIDYAMEYAKRHKNKTYIIEGIQIFIYCDNVSTFEKYAVFIKGTSAVKSFFRSAIRDYKLNKNTSFDWLGNKLSMVSEYPYYEKRIDMYRNWYGKLEANNKTKDSNIVYYLTYQGYNALGAYLGLCTPQEKEYILNILNKEFKVSEKLLDLMLEKPGIILLYTPRGGLKFKSKIWPLMSKRLSNKYMTSIPFRDKDKEYTKVLLYNDYVLIVDQALLKNK